MNCTEALGLFPPYLSGELDAISMSELRTHLASCASCARNVAQQSELDARVRREMVGEDLDTRALEARIRMQLRPRNSLRKWAGVAAALVLAVLIYRFAPGSQRVYAAAAEDHHSEVILHQHRIWAADGASFAALAAREGVSASAILSLAPAGYRLDRAKFCRLDGRVFLHLVYSDGSQEYSVFLGSHDAARPNGVRSIDVAPERVAAFRTTSLDAMVVTGSSGEDAVKLAHIAQAVLSL